MSADYTEQQQAEADYMASGKLTDQLAAYLRKATVEAIYSFDDKIPIAANRMQFVAWMVVLLCLTTTLDVDIIYQIVGGRRVMVDAAMNRLRQYKLIDPDALWIACDPEGDRDGSLTTMWVVLVAMVAEGRLAYQDGKFGCTAEGRRLGSIGR